MFETQRMKARLSSSSSSLTQIFKFGGKQKVIIPRGSRGFMNLFFCSLEGLLLFVLLVMNEVVVLVVIGDEQNDPSSSSTVSPSSSFYPRMKYSNIPNVHQEIDNEWLYEMIRVVMYGITFALTYWKFIVIGMTVLMIASWAVKLITKEQRRPVGRCWNCGESLRLTRRQIDLGWKCPNTGCNAFNTVIHASLTGRTLKSIFMRFSIYSFILLQSAHLLFLLVGSETAKLLIGTSFEKSENKLYVVEFIMLILSVVGCILNVHSIGFSFLLASISFLSCKCRLALKGVLLFSSISITVLKTIKLNEVQMDMGDEYDYERYLEERKLINRYHSQHVIQSLDQSDQFEDESENTAESTGHAFSTDQPACDITNAADNELYEIETVDLSQLSLSGETRHEQSNETQSPWSRDDHQYYKPPKYAKSYQELAKFSTHIIGTNVNTAGSSNSAETTKPKEEADTISMLSALTISSEEEDENMSDIPDLLSTNVSSTESPGRQQLNDVENNPVPTISTVVSAENAEQSSKTSISSPNNSPQTSSASANTSSSLNKYQAIGITFFMFSLTAVLAATLLNMYQISNYT